MLPPQVIVTADPFLVTAGKPGPLQSLRPLPGGPPEAGLERASREVVPDISRTGLAADPLRDHAGAERGHRAEHVRAALRSGDRPAGAVGETGSDPGPFDRTELLRRPGNHLADHEPKMRVEAPAIVAGQIFLGTQVGPGSGREG